MFEELDDKDHQDHLGQPAFQVIQAVDQKYIGGGLTPLGHINLADEQLIETQSEDQQHCRQQIAIDNLDHVSDGRATQSIT